VVNVMIVCQDVRFVLQIGNVLLVIVIITGISIHINVK
jgi:hypothetical protein